LAVSIHDTSCVCILVLALHSLSVSASSCMPFFSELFCLLKYL
jgi:hypothetical protein